MAEVNDEDIERLANRLAMMVSEEGEAANAGRAVAQLARRLGLSGGALKEMFLHGAIGGGAAKPAAPPPAAETERLEREIATLRKSLRVLEGNYRDIEAERDALHREIEGLRGRVESAQSSSQVRFILAGVLALALAGAGVVGWLVALGEGARAPAPRPSAEPLVVPGPTPPARLGEPDYGPVLRRVGVVKAPRAVAYRQPDRAAPPVATLQQGMPIVVRRIFTSSQVQWAEIEVGSSMAYVPAEELDLS